MTRFVFKAIRQDNGMEIFGNLFRDETTEIDYIIPLKYSSLVFGLDTLQFFAVFNHSIELT